jgi:hypothetical protein
VDLPDLGTRAPQLPDLSRTVDSSELNGSHALKLLVILTSIAKKTKKKEEGAVLKKWQHFERLVAAIHQASTGGAQVEWNKEIDGRQFDVIIRFKKGLYEYLTVVECKDYATPVPVEKVEAFVTKAAGVHANQAVMASSMGFQSGAQKVATKHHMELLLITESTEVDPSIFGARFGEDVPALNIVKVELEYADGERKMLPDAANAQTYYVKQIILRDGSETCSLENAISRLAGQLNLGAIDQEINAIIDCPPDTAVVAPDDGEFPLKALGKIHVTAKLVKAKTLIGPTMFDPSLLVPNIVAKKLSSGEVTTYSQSSLRLGIDTVFRIGEFYELPPIEYFYYCDRIDGETVYLLLVESYQLGMLIQQEVFTKIEKANWFVPISDKGILKRLQRRLKQVRELQASD